MTEPQDPHVVQPPPSDSELNQHIAEILITAASIYIAAKFIEKLLRPFGIGTDAIIGALRISHTGSSHKARSVMKAEGISPKAPEAKLIRQSTNEDLYYRAAYIVAASHRIQRKINERGIEPAVIRVILAEESLNYRRHEQARTQRTRAATRTARYARLFGPVLGWYLNPALNNERECIAANGNNFEVEHPPVIGLPGAVHAGCGCTAGPPHDMPPARWVNDAVASHITFGARPKLLRLKRKAG